MKRSPVFLWLLSLIALFLVACGSAQVALNSEPDQVAKLEGAGVYSLGEEVTVSVSFEPGWEFIGWSEGGKIMAETTDYTFKVKGRTELTAKFKPVEYTITVKTQGQGSLILPDQVPEHGNAYTVLAVPATEYRFVCWLEGEEQVATEASYTFQALGDRELTALFLPEIDLDYNNAFGNVNEEWTLHPKAVVTLTAAPEEGYEFFGWVNKKTGHEVETATTYSFSWEKGCSLLARFRKVLVQQEGSSLVAVVGKGTTIGKYAPTDLVTLPSNLSVKRCQVRHQVAEALEEMAAVALKDGVKINVDSGYRSYSTQDSLFYRYAKRDGVLTAERYSARAGQSEHQLGTCVDFGGTGKDYTDAFGDTKQGKWLLTNSDKFGFALSYPKGKEDVTGYKYEPWHYRYIGKELANKWKESGLTLIEFLMQQES